MYSLITFHIMNQIKIAISIIHYRILHLLQDYREKLILQLRALARDRFRKLEYKSKPLILERYL